MLHAIKEAHMGRIGIIAVIVGAIIGAVVGYSIVQSALGVVLGAVAGAAIVLVGIAMMVFIPGEIWMALGGLGNLAECCSSFAVFSLAGIVTLGGLLLWHSLVLAALAGVSVMTVLQLALSAKASLYKDASEKQSPQKSLSLHSL
jgi:hypothetical protein